MFPANDNKTGYLPESKPKAKENWPFSSVTFSLVTPLMVCDTVTLEIGFPLKSVKVATNLVPSLQYISTSLALN